MVEEKKKKEEKNNQFKRLPYPQLKLESELGLGLRLANTVQGEDKLLSVKKIGLISRVAKR